MLAPELPYWKQGSVLPLRTTRLPNYVSLLLIVIVSFVAVGGCTGCFAQERQTESACCKHNKNCDQKPAPQPGERCLTQSVDFGSAEGIRSNLPVDLAAVEIALPISAVLADELPIRISAPAEPSPHISPHDRHSLLASFLI